MGDVNAPEPRNYGQETRDTLAAQVELAPDRYASEARFSPLYQDLNASNVRRLLLGEDGKGGLLKTWEDVAPRTQALTDQTQNAQRRSDLDALRDIGLANQVGVYLVSEDRPVSEVFELKFDGTARLIATIVFNSWRRTAIPSDTKEAHR